LYGRFMTRIFGMRPGRWRLLPTSANGQPAVAAYSPGGPEERETERLALHTLQVLTVADGGISRIVVFQDPEVFEAFGLARTISAGG
jgi:RNA polymerase sigma-70 factor (ECF subfamily)